jgi:hypothetical protein
LTPYRSKTNPAHCGVILKEAFTQLRPHVKKKGNAKAQDRAKSQKLKLIKN